MGFFTSRRMNGSSIPTSQPPLRQPQLSIVPIPMNTPLPTTAELPVTMPVNSVPISWAQAPTNSIITTPSPVMVTSVNQPQPLVVNAGNPPVLLGSTSLQTQPTVNAVVTMNGPFATTPVSSGGTLTQQLNGSVSLPRSDITSVIVSQHSLPLQNNPAIISGSIPISASLAAPLPSLPSTPQAQPPVVTTSAESASRSAVIFTSKSLMELVKETDPHLQLDNETEEVGFIRSYQESIVSDNDVARTDSKLIFFPS